MTAKTPATRMQRLRQMLMLLPLLGCAEMSAAAGEYSNNSDMQALVNELVQEDGLDGTTLTTLLAGAERKQRILDAIAKPAEKTLGWAEYRPRFIEEKRIALGVAFWKQHEAALARATNTWGVPPEIIVAIIGVETYYGRNKGNWRIIDALSTLAFDYPPRSAFFRAELKEFIRLEKIAHINLADASGSYAGAMGFPQFMPSSYRRLGIDFDGDNVIDLINNPVDAIGSVANYFRASGWQPGAPVAARARVTGDGYAAVVNQGLDAKYTVAQIRAAGLTVMSCIDDGMIPIEYCADPGNEEPATAWQQTGMRGSEFWIGFRNFYVITRYNRSDKYALAVLQLSRELRHAMTLASAGPAL